MYLQDSYFSIPCFPITVEIVNYYNRCYYELYSNICRTVFNKITSPFTLSFLLNQLHLLIIIHFLYNIPIASSTHSSYSSSYIYFSFLSSSSLTPDSIFSSYSITCNTSSLLHLESSGRFYPPEGAEEDHRSLLEFEWRSLVDRDDNSLCPRRLHGYWFN